MSGDQPRCGRFAELLVHSVARLQEYSAAGSSICWSLEEVLFFDESNSSYRLNEYRNGAR